MAGIIARMIALGVPVVGRALFQAYRQALANASKTAVAQETLTNAVVRRGSKEMCEKEARLILGVSEKSSMEEIMERYNKLFENNHKSGSFYLQSKVHRAKEFLEQIHHGKGPTTDV